MNPQADPWLDLDMSAVVINHGELLTQTTFNAIGTFMMSMSGNQRVRLVVDTQITQTSTVESIGTYLSVQSMTSGGRGEPGVKGQKGDRGIVAPGGALGSAIRLELKSSQTFSTPSTTPLDFYGNPTYIYGDFQHHTVGHFSYIESPRKLESLITYAIYAEFSALALTTSKLILSAQYGTDNPATDPWTPLSECDVLVTLESIGSTSNANACYKLTASSNYLYTMLAGEKNTIGISYRFGRGSHRP